MEAAVLTHHAKHPARYVGNSTVQLSRCHSFANSQHPDINTSVHPALPDTVVQRSLTTKVLRGRQRTVTQRRAATERYARLGFLANHAPTIG